MWFRQIQTNVYKKKPNTNNLASKTDFNTKATNMDIQRTQGLGRGGGGGGGRGGGGAGVSQIYI